MKNFNQIEFIKKLISFGERQGKAENDAADFITNFLTERNIKYFLHNFNTFIPDIKNSSLIVDGEKIDCYATSFVSGEFAGNGDIVSSLIPSRYLLDYSNINFNPVCSKISRSNHYFAPSIAVSKNDLSKVMNGTDVKVKVDVEKKEYYSKNILVGNTKNPNNIIFAHYDSVSIGATDNASGVSVIMDTIINSEELLEDNLFIFSGNEELSYDRPFYWGHGFRAFEKDYVGIMRSADSLFVVDCVGNGKPVITDDLHICRLAFPIAFIDELAGKTRIMHADMNKLFKVYHSELDDISQLDNNHLDEASDLLVKELKK
ncbi:M28 family metallopeptidase [bacterium]|nr:M28 family metallopeptidase [bacterium]